eukprot:g7651.t1
MKKSRLTYLSSTKCATLVENACILGNQLYLFGLDENDVIRFRDERVEDENAGDRYGADVTDSVASVRGSSSPEDEDDESAFFTSEDGNGRTTARHSRGKTRSFSTTSPPHFPDQRINALRTCGEFGNYFFTNIVHGSVESDYPRMCANATEHFTDTLYVATAMMAGVSEGNPYHLLHLTAPAYWQLQSKHYDVCADPWSVDVRFQFPNRKQEERMNHYWRILTGQNRGRKESVVEEARPGNGFRIDTQVFDQGSLAKFWWSGLSYNPPLPLGQDLKPRCYERIVFGREPLRTGIGGFVTPTVFNFMLDRVHRQFGGWYLHGRRSSISSSSSLPAPATPVLPEHGNYCDCGQLTAEEYAAKTKQQCCSVEYDYFRRMLWHSADDDQPGEHLLGYQLDGSSHDCDFFEEAACLHRTPMARGANDEAKLYKFGGAGADVDGGGTTRRTMVMINMVLVQRKPKARRTIENVDELLKFLEAHQAENAETYSLRLLVVYLELVTPTTQYFLASRAHVWMGATGAANAWAVFMKKRGAVLLDTFPPLNGFCDREKTVSAWNGNPVTHFGGLARLTGNRLHHNCEVHKSNGGETRWYMIKQFIAEHGGGFWHSQNIHLNVDGKFKEVWQRTVAVIAGGELPPKWEAVSGVGGRDDGRSYAAEFEAHISSDSTDVNLMRHNT